jgi:hypothetical protein
MFYQNEKVPGKSFKKALAVEDDYPKVENPK